MPTSTLSSTSASQPASFRCQSCHQTSNVCQNVYCLAPIFSSTGLTSAKEDPPPQTSVYLSAASQNPRPSNCRSLTSEVSDHDRPSGQGLLICQDWLSRGIEFPQKSPPSLRTLVSWTLNSRETSSKELIPELVLAPYRYALSSAAPCQSKIHLE